MVRAFGAVVGVDGGACELGGYGVWWLGRELAGGERRGGDTFLKGDRSEG